MASKLNPHHILIKAASARRQAAREMRDAALASGYDDSAADLHRIYAQTYIKWARGHLATVATLPAYPLPR